jgi:hypothetical protein
LSKHRGMEGLATAALALLVVLGCGDGIVGASGAQGEADIESAADLGFSEDSLLDTAKVDTAPDTLPDTAPDTVSDNIAVLDTETLDTQPSPDTEPEGCWSCTTEDPDCLCGCVVCHTDKPRLQELAPPEEPDGEEEGGGG